MTEMIETTEISNLYGLIAEFETPEDLTEATRKAVDEGYKQLDAFSPFPIEELSDIVATARSHFNILPYLVLGGGLFGAGAGFFMQYYFSVIDYQMNIGGRPFNSWPAFMVASFETTILFAAFAAVLGMFLLNGLPLPYHPVFNASRFTTASSDRFFLCIEAEDPKFHLTETREFLKTLQPASLTEVDAGPEDWE